MKKILFVSTSSSTESYLVNFLENFFSVYLCDTTIESIWKTLIKECPDILVINLAELKPYHKIFFAQLKDNKQYEKMPFVAYGNKEDYQNIGFNVFSPFHVSLYHPIDGEILLTTICNLLKVKIPNYDGTTFTPMELTDIKRKVLVVDDNPVMLRTMKALLEEKYKVLLATTGVGALTTIGRERPDVILLDYDMPVCDGKMTLEMIRANEETSELPVFFLTAIADKEKIEAIFQLNPQGYLLKPCSHEKILKTLEDFFASN